jgi:hypothetical protein
MRSLQLIRPRQLVRSPRRNNSPRPAPKLRLMRSPLLIRQPQLRPSPRHALLRKKRLKPKSVLGSDKLTAAYCVQFFES